MIEKKYIAVVGLAAAVLAASNLLRYVCNGTDGKTESGYETTIAPTDEIPNADAVPETENT